MCSERGKRTERSTGCDDALTRDFDDTIEMCGCIYVNVCVPCVQTTFMDTLVPLFASLVIGALSHDTHIYIYIPHHAAAHVDLCLEQRNITCSTSHADTSM